MEDLRTDREDLRRDFEGDLRLTFADYQDHVAFRIDFVHDGGPALFLLVGVVFFFVVWRYGGEAG